MEKGGGDGELEGRDSVEGDGKVWEEAERVWWREWRKGGQTDSGLSDILGRWVVSSAEEESLKHR